MNTGFPVTHEEINEIEKLKHKDVKDLEYFFQRSSITIQKIIDGKKIADPNFELSEMSFCIGKVLQLGKKTFRRLTI